MRTGKSVAGAPARANRELGAGRRGPEEIGAANAAKTTRGLAASAVGAPRVYGPAVYRPSVRDALLDDLDRSQLDAVTSVAAPLAIIAPAGSGKTRVLTRRIAYRAREERIVARHVLAVTFTRKAAGELVSRIGRLGVDGRITAGTFHAIALAQLRRHAAERNREAPTVLERKARLLGPIVGTRGSSAAIAVADIAAEIEWAKARLIPPDRYEHAAEAAGRRPPARRARSRRCTRATKPRSAAAT